jgi:hypothetical protein
MAQLWMRCVADGCAQQLQVECNSIINDGTVEEGIKEMQRQGAVVGWMVLQNACYCPKHKSKRLN